MLKVVLGYFLRNYRRKPHTASRRCRDCSRHEAVFARRDGGMYAKENAMRFKYTILFVEDVTRSIEFFERAFGLSRRMIHESGDYGELDTGATTLSFSSLRLMTQLGKTPGKADPSSPVFEIAFETDDVAAALEKARAAGATVVQEVRAEPWGQTTAYVTGGDGYLIEICSPVGGAS